MHVSDKIEVIAYTGLTMIMRCSDRLFVCRQSCWHAD